MIIIIYGLYFLSLLKLLIHAGARVDELVKISQDLNERKEKRTYAVIPELHIAIHIIVYFN